MKKNKYSARASDYPSHVNNDEAWRFIGEDIWFDVRREIKTEINWGNEVVDIIDMASGFIETVVKTGSKFFVLKYHFSQSAIVDSFDKYIEAIRERLNPNVDWPHDRHWRLEVSSVIFRIRSIDLEAIKLRDCFGSFDANPSSFSEEMLVKYGITVRDFFYFRLDGKKAEGPRNNHSNSESCFPPEVVKILKAEYNTHQRKIQKEVIIHGGTATVVSCKGMGIVKVPGGSLKERYSRHSSVILPDGIILKPYSHGQGRGFGYSYNKSGEVVDLEKIDFSQWEIIEGNSNEKGTAINVLFGCRGGSADNFAD